MKSLHRSHLVSVLSSLAAICACTLQVAEDDEADDTTSGTGGAEQGAGAGGTPETGSGGSDDGASTGGRSEGSGGVPTASGGTAAGGDDSGDASPDPVDNCPDVDDPDQTDTDGDGEGDLCDDDDDGDGFIDGDDPAPLDPDIPGDFSTPEAILSDGRIQEALERAREAGVDIVAHTEREAPDVAGLYQREDGGGEFVASGNGEDLFRGIVGSEWRLSVPDDDHVETVSVSFSLADPISYSLAESQLLRGKDVEFTIYERSKRVCTESDSNHARWGIGITSATLDAATGDWLDLKSLSVTVATEGILTNACEDRAAGDTATEGGWAVSVTPRVKKMNVEDLEYLCVDEAKAYAPTETWSRSDGTACECTTDYEVACDE